MESILTSVKQAVGGIPFDDTTFDVDLILFINGALMILNQLGVGPVEGFKISNKEETWADFIGERTDLEVIKTDVILRVRLLFDPPQNSFLVSSIQKQIEECDWRISLMTGSNPIPVPEPGV